MIDATLPSALLAKFEPAELRGNGLGARAARWAVNNAGPIFTVFRWGPFSNIRLGGFVLATRREDVEAILADTEAFQVRFGARVASLLPDDGPVFGLGTDGAQYSVALKHVSGSVLLEDLPGLAQIVRDFVEPQVDGVRRIDLGALAHLAQAELGRRYMGLAVEDDVLPMFALWCLAIGNYAFGFQQLASPAGRVARGAAAGLAEVLRTSIKRARAARGGDTVAARLIAAGADDRTIEAALTGLLTALVPASTMAVTHAAQVLLRRPDAMAAARAAALADDDDRLERLLLEAVRFKPIFPGPFRDCVTDRTIAAGTRRAVRARKGDLVLPATQSAMFDGRRVVAPRAFDPDRPPADTLVFGFGRHWCFGFAVGRVQLVETLKPLLRHGFRQSRADRAATTYFGFFPEHLLVQLG